MGRHKYATGPDPTDNVADDFGAVDSDQVFNGTIDGQTFTDEVFQAEVAFTVTDGTNSFIVYWMNYGTNTNGNNSTNFTHQDGFFVTDGEVFQPGVEYTVTGYDLSVNYINPNSSISGMDDATYLICFARGTGIKTSTGVLRVEDLEVGDKVLTVDNGYRPIRWIGSRCVSAVQLETYPNLRPIRIQANALRRGFPEQDLTVSRQHRVMISSAVAQSMFGTSEVLIPANKLLSLPGVSVVENAEPVEYFHFMFDAHEIVFSNGLMTESLFTGPIALQSVSQEARVEIEALFPHICAPDFQPAPARYIPAKGRDMKKFVALLDTSGHPR